ncbi:MAG: CBS domain-containing protein [Chloroflexota bacterium]
MRLILTHPNTDFDGLASMLAAAKLYPGAIPVLVGAVNRNLRDFLALYGGDLPFRKLDELPDKDVDSVILVDTQYLPAVEGFQSGIHRPGLPVEIIDHHPLDRELPEGMSYTTEEVASTTAILVRQLMEKKVPLSPAEATLLLLGIYEDTGSLTYINTTSQDVRCAAWLLTHEASLQVLNSFLNRPLTGKQRLLYDQLAREAKIEDIQGHHVLIAAAQSPEYVEEVSTVAHRLNELYDAEASFVLVQMGHHLQIVARSKSDYVDVAAILRPWGGGGHNRAAAALLKDRELSLVAESLRQGLRSQIKPAATASTIMTRQARSVSPDTTISEAASLLVRYGHEGLPVVQDGRLMGIVTRRDLDRAIHHRLGNAAVRMYMTVNVPAISPDLPVPRIMQLMMEHDAGQLPVVENGQLVGIVTRTDVIAHWGGLPPGRSKGYPNLAAQLDQALQPSLRKLLQGASHAARHMGSSLYLVGGIVRDLLLGIPNFDLDLVVEGDAIALARMLAAELGGRVKAHERFGTAKWLVPEALVAPGEVLSLAPSHPREKIGDVSERRLASSHAALAIDFVTARTEFYEHPAALPEVEAGSLKQDLYRRDFTINTMAICLDRERYGELVDFYGGKKDLDRKLIRVLHSLSFVEDATRILRAVRLEQRLGFRIEKRTEELMVDARDLLERVSGERLRHELYLSLQEEEPEKILRRLDQCGLLAYLHRELRYTDWLGSHCAQAREKIAEWNERFPRAALAPQRSLPRVYLALLVYPMREDQVVDFTGRLKITGENSRLLRELGQFSSKARITLQPGPSPTAIYALYQKSPAELLYVLWFTDEVPGKPEEPLPFAVSESVELFLHKLKWLKVQVNGETLKSFGLRPGPVYRRLLNDLYQAKLNGKVESLEDEMAFVRAWLAAAPLADRQPA